MLLRAQHINEVKNVQFGIILHQNTTFFLQSKIAKLLYILDFWGCGQITSEGKWMDFHRLPKLISSTCTSDGWPVFNP